MIKRRNFIKASALAGTGISLGLTAKSYANIIGANEKTNVAILGCYRRFPALAGPLSAMKDVNIRYVSDVDSRRQAKGMESISKKAGYDTIGEKNMNHILDDKDVDAVFIALPDHWHAPAAWMAMDAGKHVYVEKPASHNPNESELLIKLQKKYGKVVQMGNQQRSSPESQEIITAIHEGIIGKAYKALAFYSNSRGRVPDAHKVPAPDYLDWDLFQGPAPRQEFIDIVGDYNWHWYWQWGTGETGNNATHELDIARWALEVNFPKRAKVEAYKQHFVDDPWTMYDTMYATFEFEDQKVINWDGKSRNAYNTYGAGRGTIIYGSEGSVFIDRSLYKHFDRAGKLVKEVKSDFSEGGVNLGGGGGMTNIHVHNFLEAVRGKAKQNSNIEDGAISTNLCHYANISYKMGNQALDIDPATGRFTDKNVMKKHWARTYEKGYEPPKV
ncbi:Gfo/Idh/MocA family protein [Portibacter lacus]|uniref:Dehydrogenase n=1 Tax=Portibacter lacus TaxID=1099794 RepID=A0AA37SPC3_9BACT|nr:Gfo/Idh/MocA family oxidoreductase [Portibacter lacus]GLR18398.1 dehydrogenase [Portibacter lacus]